MKTNIGLLVGGLVLLLGSTASAGTFQLCGSVGSTTGSNSVAFTTSANGAGGTASTSAGVGTITCNPFTVPSGDTLTGVTIQVNDDAQQPESSNSVVTWTWSYSGSQSLTPTPTGSFDEAANGSGTAFSACTSTGGSPTLVCDNTANFSLTPIVGNGANSTGSFSFSVTPTASGDNGVGPTGSDSAQVYISFTYVPTSSIPEPTSLLLIGSGLVGLGVFARRKRQ